MAAYASAGVGTCLAPDSGDSHRPETPPALHKFRQSQVGRRFIHRGMEDMPVSPDTVFGKVEPQGLNVGQLMAAQSGQSEWLQGEKEIIYKSHQRSPLGHSRKPIAELPAAVREESFRFGSATAKSSFSAADLVVPACGSTHEWKTIKQQNLDRKVSLARMSATDRIMRDPHRPSPEEIAARQRAQRRREQNRKTVHGGETVATSIVQKPSVTRIVKRKEKKPVQQPPPDVVHGQLKHDQHPKDDWNAAQCIQGHGWNQDDANGTNDNSNSNSRVVAFKNRRKKLSMLPREATDQIHGTPTKQKTAVSTADLLFPTTQTFGGINTQHFSQDRNADEIKRIFSTAGFNMTDEEFKTISDAATRRGRLPLTVQSFRDAYNRIKHGV